MRWSELLALLCVVRGNGAGRVTIMSRFRNRTVSVYVGRSSSLRLRLFLHVLAGGLSACFVLAARALVVFTVSAWPYVVLAVLASMPIGVWPSVDGRSFTWWPAVCVFVVVGRAELLTEFLALPSNSHSFDVLPFKRRLCSGDFVSFAGLAVLAVAAAISYLPTPAAVSRFLVALPFESLARPDDANNLALFAVAELAFSGFGD